MAGRFLSNRDISNLIDRANKEVLKTVVGTDCVLYKHEVSEIKTNVYGEVEGGKGKVFQKGVTIPCLITSEDITYQTNEFGPDAQQGVSFAFHRNSLIDLNVAPEVGDIIEWNYAYFAIHSINENQLLGGDVDKNHDLIANCHMTRQSKLNLVDRVR